MTGQRVVAVFGSSHIEPGSSAWSAAETMGGELAGSGFAVVTGGYGGVMEAVSEGASESGGHVIGVTAPPLFPDRAGANRYVSEVIEADDLVSRIGTMIDLADGVIVMPGSIGTATELMIAWNHNYLSRHNGQPLLPTVAVGEGWRALMDVMLDRVGAEPGDVHVVDLPRDALDWILQAL